MDNKQRSTLTGANKIFAENINFDESENDRREKRARGWRAFAIAGWVMASIATVSAATIASIHEVVPVVVSFDKLSGNYDVRVGKERLNLADPDKEPQIIADLVRYTRAREGFTRGESDHNYRTLVMMSAPHMRGEIDNEFLAARNPNALVNTMTSRDLIELDNISVSFSPVTEGMKETVAQVRYDKIKRILSKEPTTQRFISTYTFTYDKEAIPNTVEGIALNFDGFQLINRRRDKLSEEMPLASTVTPPADVYPAVSTPVTPGPVVSGTPTPSRSAAVGAK